MKVANPLARLGEDLACVYLKNHGYKIIERNFHARGGEIDIVAIDTSEKEETLAFIEVKTRSSLRFGTPFEAISYWKIRSLTRIAAYYSLLHKSLPQKQRIDAVSVFILSKNERKIELVKNAVLQ